MNPSGNINPDLSIPKSKSTKKPISSLLRRKERCARGGRSVKSADQSAVSITCTNSSAVIPDAYRPPTIAPMLVPATKSTGTCKSSSTLITPTCAAPRAPPPLRTRPTVGRVTCSPSGALTFSEANDADITAPRINSVQQISNARRSI